MSSILQWRTLTCSRVPYCSLKMVLQRYILLYMHSASPTAVRALSLKLFLQLTVLSTLTGIQDSPIPFGIFSPCILPNWSLHRLQLNHHVVKHQSEVTINLIQSSAFCRLLTWSFGMNWFPKGKRRQMVSLTLTMNKCLLPWLGMCIALAFYFLKSSRASFLTLHTTDPSSAW